LHGISDTAQGLLNMSPSSTNLAPDYTMEGPLDGFTLPNFETDVDMLAAFEMDLGPMDLTTDFGAGAPPISAQFQNDANRTSEAGEDVVGQLPVCTGINVGGGMSADMSAEDRLGELPVCTGMNVGGGMSAESGIQDYAELYRVNAATASPLRRRVSEKQAAKVGSSRDPTGNMYAG